MKITDISNDDGKACAFVLHFLKSGKWELSGEGADQLVLAKRWVASVAQQMASQLKAPAAPVQEPAPAPAMKVKAMGPIAGSKKKSK